MAHFFNGKSWRRKANGQEQMRVSVIIPILVLLCLSTPTSAQGFFGQIFCNGSITDEVRGAVRYSARFSVGYLDLEIANRTNLYHITAVSIRFEGSYNGRSFVRRYDEREVEIAAGTSARLVFQTDIPGSYMDNTDVDDIRLIEVFGCKE